MSAVKNKACLAIPLLLAFCLLWEGTRTQFLIGLQDANANKNDVLIIHALEDWAVPIFIFGRRPNFNSFDSIFKDALIPCQIEFDFTSASFLITGFSAIFAHSAGRKLISIRAPPSISRQNVIDL